MKRKALLASIMALLLAVCISFAGCGSTDKDSAEKTKDVKVTAPTGTYIGQENNGVAEFKGIRYGEFAPFKPAADVTTTEDDQIEATEFGKNCIQPYDEVEVASQDPCSQDCLFLNVWTKDVATKDKPVIMFIHGGSCIWGGTSDPTYDGEYFVRNLAENEDCVFITINYRLSILGSLDLSGLEGYTDDYASAINLSKLDQTQALKWINQNIEAWGGDTENVTIMGQSAGGGAVEMLMADTDTHKYFNRAVINSGSQSREALSKEKVKSNSEKVFKILGVKSIEELTALTDKQISDKMTKITDELGEAHPGLKCADGKIISETWWEDLQNGAAKDIDLLIGGTNGEEDWNSIDWDNSISKPIKDPDTIKKCMEDIDDARADTYGRFYALDQKGFYDGYLAMGDDKVKQAQDLFNDVYFNYPTHLIAEVQAKHNKNTYLYNWEYAPDMNSVLDYNGDAAEVSPWGRALHCMDLCFEFGTKEGYPEMTGDPKEMSDDMIAQAREMLYSFAKIGNPSNDLIGEWKPFDNDQMYSMVITKDAKWDCKANYRRDIIDYMKKLTPYGM
ncbi:carboxylesterase family protein [Ihubacter massiliensis]|uniref:Carboxylesterase family protein n=1 Tax=Hominibacterium faecale TaxID=2839743 RepID=A0A9J6QMX2_9FIRM|nr:MULTISPECIES: carboxylesterase family protein [Eubacteriales Family XIII. Incertae Sedis]MCO7121541.1 carboxylesterase family protein [Ihubacter massiliensis]MCU7378521.1 carboxylesterase family protein [Hominibacterium faecale]